MFDSTYIESLTSAIANENKGKKIYLHYLVDRSIKNIYFVHKYLQVYKPII